MDFFKISNKNVNKSVDNIYNSLWMEKSKSIGLQPVCLFFGVFIVGLYSLKGVTRPILFPDSEGYLYIAKMMNGGGRWWESTRPPGYPLFIYIGYLLTSSWKAVAYIQVGISALASLALYYLIRRHTVRNFAMVTAFLIMVDPLIIHWHAITLTESVATSSLLIWVALKVYILKNCKWDSLCLFLSICSDLCLILIKPVFFLLPLGTYFYLLLIMGLHKFIYRKWILPQPTTVLYLILVSTLFNVLLIFIQTSRVHKQIGRYEMSTLTSYNHMGNAMRWGYLKKEFCPESGCAPQTLAAIKAYHELAETISPFKVSIQVVQNNPQWSRSEVVEATLKDIFWPRVMEVSAHSLKDVKLMIENRSMYHNSGDLLNSINYKNFYKKLHSLFSFIAIPAIGLMAFLVLFISLGKRPAPYFTLIICGLATSYLIVVSAVGVYNEFGRLVVPYLPLYHGFLLTLLYRLLVDYIPYIFKFFRFN